LSYPDSLLKQGGGSQLCWKTARKTEHREVRVPLGNLFNRLLHVLPECISGGLDQEGGVMSRFENMESAARAPARITAVALLAVLTVLALGGVRGSEATEPNLVENPGFEQPSAGGLAAQGWQGNRQIFSLDPEVTRSGTASLKYVNTDAKRYVLCTQKVPLQAGWKCRVSAWVKTEKVIGEDSGATICLEWQGKDGKWLGGVYPSGVKGTRDWTRIEAITRLPEDAASCNLACYVRQGMTGTAWFDDVEAVRIADPPLDTVLLSPVYRGRITPAGPEEICGRVRLRLADYDLQPQQVRVQVALRSADGPVRWETDLQPTEQQGDQFDVRVPARGLEPGRYELTIRLADPAGRELQLRRHELVRLAGDRRPHCEIDQQLRLLVDGRPFFPLGMYWSGINEKDIQVYADSKFNCLMPYGSPNAQQMDLAHRHGLKVIYSVKDWYAGMGSCPKFIQTEADEEPQIRARVREYRNHPALLAWYLNDELPQSYLPRLEAHQRWVAEEDFDHPTWVVLYQYREVAAYLNTFDVIGTDPYPIGRGPASTAAAWTAETFRQVERARPMWQVPQLHNWANYAKSEAERQRGRTPTVDEVRSMAWQCICEGATGLVFYSWYDVKRNPDVTFDAQWTGLKQIAAEIDRAAPMLLSAEPVPAIKVVGPAPSWLRWLARSHAGKLYVAAVNDGDGEGPVAFALPGAPRSVRVLGQNAAVPATPAGFQDTLKPLAVRVYEIEM